MAVQTNEFFTELQERGHEPLLKKASGVIRFEIADEKNGDEIWIVAIDHGDVEVSQENVAGDARFRIPRALFDRIVRGEANPTAAMLRGAMEGEGEWRLLVLAERLFAKPTAVPA